MRRKVIVIMLVLGASFPMGPAAIVNAATLEPTWHSGGRSNAVAVWGRYACLGVGLRMVVLDVSDPNRPLFVSQSEPLGEVIQDLDVWGRYAYVAAGSAGLYVIDLIKPANPVIVGSWRGEGSAISLGAWGWYVYVLTGDYYLRIIDTSNPAKPVRVASFKPNSRVYSLEIQYPLVFVAGRELYILEWSGHSNPSLLAQYSLDEQSTAFLEAKDVAVLDDYACLACGDAGLKIIDVKDPRNPVQVGLYRTTRCVAIEAANNLLYILDSQGLGVVDIMDPWTPKRLGLYQSSGVRDLTIIGRYAYLAKPLDFYIIQIEDPTQPRLVGRWGLESGGPCSSLAIDDGFMFVADNARGLRILDITDPTRPLEIGLSPVGGYANSIVRLQRYLYLANGQNGLKILDVNDLSKPVGLGSYFIGTAAQDVAVQDGYAYVAGLRTGLHVIDVSDPNWPFQVGYLPSEDSCLSVVADGNYVYLADFLGLWIIDVADPAWPVAIARYPQYGAREVKIHGNYAYLACNRPGLKVLDISDKSRPTEVAAVDYDSSLRATPNTLSLGGDYLFLGCYTSVAITQTPGLLAVLNISRPNLPREVLTYKLPWQPTDMDTQDDIMAVSCGDAGLLVFRLRP